MTQAWKGAGEDATVNERFVVDPGHIRAFAEAVEDDNALWTEPAFAAKHGYRSTVAPPTFAEALNPIAAARTYPVDPGLPHDFSAGNDYRMLHPIVAGDVIDVEVRVADVTERTRGDGSSRMVLVTYERRLVRADGLRVGVVRWRHGHFEGEPARDPTANRVADDAPPVVASASLRVDAIGLVRWGHAVDDHHPIHYDRGYMRELGFRDVVGDGGRSSALAARALTDWLGSDGVVRELRMDYLGFAYVDDVLTATARAAGGDGPGQGRAVRLAVTNQDDSLVARGRAVVDVPDHRRTTS